MTIIDFAPATSRGIAVERQASTLGAQVRDVDLSAPLDDQLVADLRAALLTHKVLFFPDQELDPASHVALAEAFGTPTAAHPVMPPYDDRYPQIWQIDNTKTGARNDIWHTDVTFVQRPPLGSILRAIQVPDFGGDTSWACLEAAYNSLPTPLQRLADGLTAFHDGTNEFASTLTQRGHGNDWEGQTYTRLDAVEHPVVRIHPETGRKSLFVNPGFTTAIKGFEPSDSRALLDLFFSHIARPEHTVRHRWNSGDVVFWDNRNTVHYANDDVVDFQRLMHRITLTGDEPHGPANSGNQGLARERHLRGRFPQ